MPELTAAEIAKMVRNKDFQRVYYIYGKDTAMVQNLTKLILKKANNSEYTKIEGDAFNFNAFTDMADMYPMFTEYNCILINDFNADNLGTDMLKLLCEYIKTIPETTIIIFNITGFDIKCGKKTASAKNKKLMDSVKSCGMLCEINFKTVSELSKIITDMVARESSTINKKNAEKIAELCLCDTMLITNEVAKLCAYANGEEITSQIIDMLVSKQLDSNAFMLAKSVVSLNANEAMQLLDELFQQRAEGVVILSAITSSFIDLYRARAALSANRNINDITNDFNYRGREFVVRNAVNSCGKISIEHLRYCIEILCNTDKALKSIKTEPRVLIEQAISEMILKARM